MASLHVFLGENFTSEFHIIWRSCFLTCRSLSKIPINFLAAYDRNAPTGNEKSEKQTRRFQVSYQYIFDTCSTAKAYVVPRVSTNYLHMAALIRGDNLTKGQKTFEKIV